MAARFTAAQYAQAFMALLPRGRVWNRDPESTQSAVAAGVSQIYEQIDSDANQLLVDAFPATTTALLDEWNSSVGIPDFCFGPPQTIEQNRQQIVAKLVATGGQSIAYYTSLAAALGINITITEFSNWYSGTDAPEGYITTINDWCYTFRVNVDTNSPALLVYSGDVSEIQSSSVYQSLSCLLNRFKPAHTQLYFEVVDFSILPTGPLFGFDLDTPYISGFDTGIWSS